MVKWKNLPSKYYTQYRIGLGGCQAKEIVEAREFLTQQIPGLAESEEVPESEITRQLWRLYESESSDKLLAEVCLRCAISHYLKESCYKLVQQYGRKHNFSVEDLLPLVLDSADSSLNHGNNNSFTVYILQTFNLQKSSLSAWTKILFRSHTELKSFLLQHGIEQVTDWLLLKQYNSRQLQRILSESYHYSPIQIQQFTKLLESYQIVYLSEIQAARNQINQERKQQGLGKIKSPYPVPNHQQLQQMSEELLPTWRLSTDEFLEELKKLAQLIREYKSSRKGIATKVLGESVTNLSTNIYYEDEDDASDNSVFLTQLLQDCLITAIKEVTEERVNYLQSKKKKKDKQFIQGLHLFHCQHIPMEEIAKLLGLNNQSQVSRLLELKSFRADISRRTLVKLRSELLKIAQTYNSPKQLRDLEQDISKFLDETISTVMQDAEKEASVSRNRLMTSKLSVTICQYLDTIKDVK
ncbi:hypothetical protein FDUTEX481_05245 [Tolypothrix sp. PCC 7601]|nr:hypothetical protein FDUTEX481_05245 [Tolypothrix sp. PCC 7601]BAY95705.1 hypothetical protein NIES3275_77820 [Microchaete diplosiphon NIES-3275]